MERIPQRDVRGGTVNNNKDEVVSHIYALRGRQRREEAQPNNNERAHNERADNKSANEDEDEDKRANNKSANEDEDNDEDASITSTNERKTPKDASITSTNERKTPKDASITSTNERKTPAMETTCISFFLLNPLTVYFLSGFALELFVFSCDQDHKALDKRSIKTAYKSNTE
jgi:hypothetical protein